MYKLYSKVCFCICLLVSNFNNGINIKAESFNHDEESDIISEPVIVKKYKQIGDTIYTEMIYSNGEEQYIIDVFGETLIVYDSNMKVVATASYSFETGDGVGFIPPVINTNPILAIQSDFDVWQSWVPANVYVKVIPIFTGSLLSSVLSALLSAAFSQAELFGYDAAISILAGIICSAVVSGQEVTTKGQKSLNQYCTILQRERVNQYNNNYYYVIQYGNPHYSWLDNPYDYSYPYECRVLANTY